MYEPKYKLNRKDAERWHSLLVRHCLDCPVKPGQKRRFSRKYPPLTPEENAEFEALSAKRSKKIESHPKVKAAIRASMRHIRKTEKLLAQLEALVKKMKRRKSIKN